ncbi:MAG TPA: DinB family protein [Candidatus Cybelea sp.]|nr:DinB family protein [Candidatus Cybelea sp.]
MPATLVGTFRAMAYNNAWANHRLLAACARLSQAEFEASRPSFFPSIKLTLNHVLIIDWFYVDSLEGGWLGPKAWADPAPCATVAALQHEQAAVDRRLIAVCEALTEAVLSGEVRVNRGDTRVQIERRDRLLMHLFQHQIHHRGQAHAMLAGTTVKPPQLDEFFSEGEAPLRAADLAALGWSEATVWGGETFG